MNINDNLKYDNSVYPKRILQFGQGNFLRGFIDWIIDLANDSGDLNSSIVIAKATNIGDLSKFKEQNNKYTLIMRGIENGVCVEDKKIISSISEVINPYKEDDFNRYEEIITSDNLEIIISNTTESGIIYESLENVDNYPKTFPAKIAKLLFERFKAFNGNENKGLLFLPVELIDNNGDRLKEIVIRYAKDWKLGEEFIDWINISNKFANTLVDRIVTGYPKNIEEIEKKLGYRDKLLVTSEVFNLWVIEGKESWKNIFSVDDDMANVIWTDDVSPFKKRKVRILNGGHSSTVHAALLDDFNIVRDMIEDEEFNNFYDHIVEKEIIPTIDMNEEELLEFSKSVKDRFLNPFIDHKLFDITLNSIAKFKTRCLDSLLDYYSKYSILPKGLVFSFAALIRFYKIEENNGVFYGYNLKNKKYILNDDYKYLSYFTNAWKLKNLEDVVINILGNREIWDDDLNEIPELKNMIIKYLEEIEIIGIKEILKEIYTGKDYE